MEEDRRLHHRQTGKTTIDERHHLDCPGLEGVWFINSDITKTAMTKGETDMGIAPKGSLSSTQKSGKLSKIIRKGRNLLVPLLILANVNTANSPERPVIGPEKTLARVVASDDLAGKYKLNIKELVEVSESTMFPLPPELWAGAKEVNHNLPKQIESFSGYRLVSDAGMAMDDDYIAS